MIMLPSLYALDRVKKSTRRRALPLLAVFWAVSTIVSTSTLAQTIDKRPYCTTPDGAAIDLYTIANGKIEVDIITYGGIVTSLKAPDRSGKTANVVLGFPKLGDYVTSNPYFGAIIGRYGNRIGNGRFSLSG